jgi:hypothetical protein
MAMPWLL